MKRDAEKHKEEDAKNKEKVDTINLADHTIHQTETQLKELKDKLSKDDFSNIESKLNKLKEDKKSEDIDKIKSSMDELNQVFQKVSQEMYKNAQETQETQETSNSTSSKQSKNSKKEATDADYEVIDDEYKIYDHSDR